MNNLTSMNLGIRIFELGDKHVVQVDPGSFR